jgi:ketopantoate hydroxymethyltransferase
MLQKNARVLWIVAGLTLLVPRPARGADEVSGNFTVKGETTTFGYVYTYWKPNFFDQAKKDLFVLFSDAPIPAGSIPKNDDGISKIASMVREGKIHALELHLSPVTRRLDEAENAAVYHVGLSPARHGMSGMHVFEARTFDARTVEAMSRTEKEQDDAGVRWRYEVRFRVAIPPR